MIRIWTLSCGAHPSLAYSCTTCSATRSTSGRVKLAGGASRRCPAASTATGTELWFKRYLADPEICKDPKGWAMREAERVLNELRGVRKNRSHP